MSVVNLDKPIKVNNACFDDGDFISATGHVIPSHVLNRVLRGTFIGGNMMIRYKNPWGNIKISERYGFGLSV